MIGSILDSNMAEDAIDVTSWNCMKTSKPYQCVRSGACCKTSLCRFGQGVNDKAPCTLLGGTTGEHYCTIYDWIKTQDGWEDNPAFGEGCQMPMNSDRLSILEEMARIVMTAKALYENK